MVMLFSGLGIMSTIFVGTLFLINNDTPLVKASGRELSCTLLFGLLSCYTFSFFMLAEPSPSICAIQRFGLGFSFCVCYASILIRTNRIARIFERSNRSTKPPLFINPASQIAILTVFVSIDIVFSVIGLVKWPPETILAYPTNKDVLLICNIEDYDLVFALTYNVLIIILCTFYAFRTRKTPANFNEARYIGFAMYTTCIIWVAFLPVQIGVNKDYATITLAINTTLNATTLLLCIFGPKVYILVFRPTRNLRSRSLNSWRAHDAENVPNTQGRPLVQFIFMRYHSSLQLLRLNQCLSCDTNVPDHTSLKSLALFTSSLKLQQPAEQASFAVFVFCFLIYSIPGIWSVKRSDTYSSA